MTTEVPPRPTDAAMQVFDAVISPLRAWASMDVSGVENLPDDGRFLLVGNHSLYGLYDALVATEVHRRKGLVVRALADRDQFKVPFWRDILPRIGGVLGSPANCAELMRRGETILVFPGGSREVWKGPGQEYQLQWGDRMGFARIALEHGYPIVPFAQLGGDEAYRLIIGATHPAMAPVRWIGTRVGLRANNIPSISIGKYATPIPRRKRAYVLFTEPVDTTHLSGSAKVANVESIRDQVHDAINAGVEALKQRRAADEQPS